MNLRRVIIEVGGGLLLAAVYALVVWLDPASGWAQLHEAPALRDAPAQPPVWIKPRQPEGGLAEDEQTQAQEPPSRDAVPARRYSKLAQQTGVAAAQRRLGRDTPTGRGVAVGHVEGNAGSYVPAIGKRFGAIAFVPRSGPSEPNGHTSMTAGVIYGSNGLAPGIRLVNNFTARGWMTKGYLHTGSANPPAPPGTDDKLRVFTHSWIGDPPDQAAEQVLRRLDYQIDRRDIVVCAGVNNNRGSKVPPLLASSYNAIAVGVSSGDSSGGYTTMAQPGRCKPDLTAPGPKTSYATPVVAALAARLIEQADRMARITAADQVPEALAHDAENPDADAEHAQVIKAVLMAGAVKPEGWHREKGKPLDEHLGAGVVNFDNSLRILSSGNTAPGVVRAAMGWSFAAVAEDQSRQYRFNVRAPMTDVSMVLTWNRRIFGHTATQRITSKRTGKIIRSRKVWVDIPRLADLDLRLVRLDDAGKAQAVAASTTEIGNVEHLSLPKLTPGRYRLTVKRKSDSLADKTWAYALAWRLSAK